MYYRGVLARRSLIHLAWWSTLAAAPLPAQLYQGVVRDSLARTPVAGVVISALDSAGKPAARTLSGQDGRYRMFVPASADRLRIQRIGYRMRELPLKASAEETVAYDVALAPVPSLLDPVRVLSASACPRRRDNADTQALYEQARAGLLATVVAREANPASVVRYAFDRPVMLWPDSAPVRVTIDSTRDATTAFKTSFTGADLVAFGFKRRVGDQWQYAGPDAEVLLDDGFANGYCFSIAPRDRTRRSQIGLSFAAADKQHGRLDIAGTLWIDTVARALRSIEYQYTGAEGLAQYLGTGGRTSFMEMPNGIVAVTQWSNRLLQERIDTVDDGSGKKRAVHGLMQNEGGGYLARATWPDGTQWVAPMGTARLVLMLNDTTPVVANDVRLARTDYRGTTDNAGRVEIRDLFPGRYALIVRDTLLEELGFEPDPQFEFVSVPGSVFDARVRVQSTAEQLMQKCRKKTSRTDLLAVVNVKDAAVGAPGVKVDVTFNGASFSETTNASGSFVLCLDRDALGAQVAMVGARGDMRTQTLTHTLSKRVTLFRLQLAKAAPVDTVSARVRVRR
jgi:hypothetical protein